MDSAQGLTSSSRGSPSAEYDLRFRAAAKQAAAAHALQMPLLRFPREGDSEMMQNIQRQALLVSTAGGRSE